MDDPLYREIILENFQHPQNYGVMAKPDIDITEQNTLCGDKIRIMAKIKDNKIAEISFESDGCAISKAAASLLTVETQGMAVKKFYQMKPEEFLATFKIGFSPVRIKCALLGFSTLKKALRSHLGVSGA